MRTITIEAGDLDLPIDLQVVQEASAAWNGQTIEITLNLMLGGRYEILRAPIMPKEARLFLMRLQAALKKAQKKGAVRKSAS
jgi:hypothetical protein